MEWSFDLYRLSSPSVWNGLYANNGVLIVSLPLLVIFAAKQSDVAISNIVYILYIGLNMNPLFLKWCKKNDKFNFNFY